MSKALVLYIQVAAPTGTRFGHPFSLSADEADTFGFDNHSDATMFSYARRLVTEASGTFVYIEASNPKENLGIVRSFMSFLVEKKPAGRVLLSGHHPMLDRMATAAGAERVSDATEANSVLAEWLTGYSDKEKGSASR
ncbi:MAG: hypothetical protein WBB45_09210 [Cyclobacteriaceae bacterium]